MAPRQRARTFGFDVCLQTGDRAVGAGSYEAGGTSFPEEPRGWKRRRERRRHHTRGAVLLCDHSTVGPFCASSVGLAAAER